ncbi:hypothetical protein Daura_32955 [Dactylosporangium aurantiacum]|uniref:Secreted protein n=1 Tax=Dactylosporangium aurantiacum TaxID=35754 RepID=A0A9Q9MJ34_9ACTN|nr:hypothetical protein [Dactylosporangium aurantiacum]MDG6105002.1 hypothetical protein [Dactylosporangium aurantiacum]UWZ51537.1 hypothetical protein Daura_32955 [Dactylosporangium aurantiacum]
MRAIAVLAAGATVAATLLTATTSASAAAAPTALPAGQFTLSANYHQFDALNTALVSTLGTAAVHTVMDNANHDRTGITDSLGISYETGFSFDSGDDNDCTNFPQGITTSRDAIGTANSGNYDGHQLILVSWYTKDGCDGASSRSRITLVDWDATYPNKYRKILLVEPTGTTAAPDFKDIKVHAGGVSWFGDYLYVADTGRGMRVFDMRKILKTSTGGTAAQIGRQSATTYYAHNYAYVLPQIGTVTAATTSGTNLAWSSISLDRVSRSIVMTEYTCSSGCTDYPNRAPRAVRFPFASGATTFAASTTATQALQLPWYKLNGVASHNGRWWFNSSGSKQLYYWTPSAGPHTYAWVSGGESISYWEDAAEADLLWSLQEPIGHRNVFAVKQANYDG